MTSTKTLAGAGPGDPEVDPDALAARVFELYERRELPELKVGNYIAQAFAARPAEHPNTTRSTPNERHSNPCVPGCRRRPHHPRLAP